MGIGRVLIGIKNLDFRSAQGEEARISPALPRALDHLWGAPLDVILTIAKLFLGSDGSRSTDHFHSSVHEFPFHFATLSTFPFVEILAVKQNDGVGGGVPALSGVPCTPGVTTGGTEGSASFF